MAAAALPLLFVGLAGGVISARAQERQAKSEATAAETAAREEQRVTRERVEQIKRKRSRLLASQRAAITARGVKLSGSPLELLAETNEIVDIDISRLRRQGEFRARAFRQRGKEALRRGRTGALVSLIGSVAQGTRVASSITASEVAAGFGPTDPEGRPVPFGAPGD